MKGKLYFVLLLFFFSFFQTTAQTLVKSLPMKINSFRSIDTWELQNEAKKEIIWIWATDKSDIVTSMVSVKRLNYQFEILEEFSARIPTKLYPYLKGGFMVDLGNQYKCIFEGNSGHQILSIDFHNKRIQYETHSLQRKEIQVGTVHKDDG